MDDVMAISEEESMVIEVVTAAAMGETVAMATTTIAQLEQS